MALANQARKHLRSIMKQVHPDLFPANDLERQTNTESLKLLNVYVEQLSNKRTPKPAELEFFVKNGGSMKKVHARLTASGSLSPLFFAFGYIDAAQLAQDISLSGSDTHDTSLMFWLRDQVQEAVKTAEQHEILKWNIRNLRTRLEDRFKLSGVQAGAEYAASIAEQERQLEALKLLDQALTALINRRISFEGISIQLYHPQVTPQGSKGFFDDAGSYHRRSEHMRAFVADDGCVHVVADRHTMRQQLEQVDVQRARTLAHAAYFWSRRVKDVTGPIESLLGIRKVWCDAKTEHISMKFVLWAGHLLEKRDQVKAALAGRNFSFNIIVHTDPSAPLISFNNSSPILNVSADCPPDHLLDFLVSEAGGAASSTAGKVHMTRAQEEALLENVRKALRAKCVIKICMSDKVLAGAQRLLDNASFIRNSIDLTGACIALDDCYEVWDSGFISIPYDFRIQDLPEMVRQLKSGGAASLPSSTSGSAKPSTVMASLGSRATQPWEPMALRPRPASAAAGCTAGPASSHGLAGCLPTGALRVAPCRSLQSRGLRAASRVAVVRVLARQQVPCARGMYRAL